MKLLQHQRGKRRQAHLAATSLLAPPPQSSAAQQQDSDSLIRSRWLWGCVNQIACICEFTLPVCINNVARAFMKEFVCFSQLWDWNRSIEFELIKCNTSLERNRNSPFHFKSDAADSFPCRHFTITSLDLSDVLWFPFMSLFTVMVWVSVKRKCV